MKRRKRPIYGERRKVEEVRREKKGSDTGVRHQ